MSFDLTQNRALIISTQFPGRKRLSIRPHSKPPHVNRWRPFLAPRGTRWWANNRPC